MKIQVPIDWRPRAFQDQRWISSSLSVGWLNVGSHRCRIAGASEPPFDDRAMATLYEMGRGNPRATDRLARRALETAHRAGDTCVGAQHVIAARATLQP